MVDTARVATEAVVPEERSSGANSGSVQSIDRAFALLELMAEAGGGLTLSDLAARSGLAPATIHRLLRTLAKKGYVRQDESRGYTLGARLIFIGRIASQMLGAWARPFLVRLADETDETANLAALDADEVVFLAQVPSQRHYLRMFTEVGRRVPAHATAVGKVLMAQVDDEYIRRLVRARGLAPYSPSTITDEGELLRHIRLVRLQGFAIEDGEQEVGLRCVAVPVPNSPRNLALSISGPESRMSLVQINQFVPVLQRLAADLSRAVNDPT